MSIFGERAAAHYGNLSRRTIEVPEWGASASEPLVIHARPPSVIDAQAIFKAGAESSFEIYVEAIIRLSEDEKGNKLFDIGDKPLLRRASKDVVERVGAELLRKRSGAELMEPFEAEVKN